MRLRSILCGAVWTCMILGTTRAQTSSPPATPGGPTSSPAAAPAGQTPPLGAVVQGPQSFWPIAPPPCPPTVIQYHPSIDLFWGPYGPVPYAPPLVVIGSGAGWPYWLNWPVVPTVRGPYPEELYPPPPPPQVPLALRLPPPDIRPRPKRIDPGQADELIRLGDRHFRANDLRRASERYEQALRIRPGSAAALVRFAQVALVRGQYIEAAHRLREALTVDPDWLRSAPDIQDLYGEPADFAAQIAKLERHLQAHPNDRDAWLVLGAQWFLSGRIRQASDVFLRLTDRPPDPTLAAFLDASKAKQ